MSAIVNDLAILLVFLLIGFALRELIKPLQKLFLPAGLIGGIVLAIVGAATGAFADYFNSSYSYYY